MEEFLNRVVLGNTLADLLKFAGILLLGFIFKRFGAKMLSGLLYIFFRRYAKQQHGHKFIALVRRPVETFFLIIIIFSAFKQISFPNDWEFLNRDYDVQLYVVALFKILTVFSITWIILRISDFYGYVFKSRTRKFGKSDPQMVVFMKDLSKIIIVIIAFFFILKMIFRLDLVGVIAGLGIGGLALALAAQETIANLLGSFIIFSDKPFVVGDLVETTDIKGVVESVGFRSTRIRTLDKTLLTVPNKKLVDAAVNNISNTSIRRIRFTICITYDATADQLRKLIDNIKSTLEEHPLVEKNYLVTFAELNNNYIGIEVIYFGVVGEADQLALIKEDINFRIIDMVHNNGLKFVAQNPGIVFAGNISKPK